MYPLWKMPKWTDPIKEFFSYFMIVPYFERSNSFDGLVSIIYAFSIIILIFLCLTMFLGYKIKNGV